MLMPIYEFTNEEIRTLQETSFDAVNVQERRDLQRLLRAKISVVAPDTLVIAEEFNDWQDSNRRIDLLGVDRQANLVVIELKRTEDGGHMELQAIRYASMVSTMTFEQATNAFSRYLRNNNDSETDARTELLNFLKWDEPDEDAFAQTVRIVLVAADFGRELTTSVLWLNEQGVDILCVRIQPYKLDKRLLVDVQQIIPLPEIAGYLVRVAEKRRKEKEGREEYRKVYDVTLGGNTLTRLPMRHAIYQTFRYLVAKNIAPQKVADNCGTKSKQALISIDGELGSEDFCRTVTDAWAKEGNEFKPEWFFSKDDELVHFKGRTYAFSNQWPAPSWKRAMSSLREAFSDHEIEFVQSK